MRTPAFVTGLIAVLLAGCGHRAELPVSAGVGSSPQIPAPANPLIPTLNIAPATGWPEGTAPVPATGLAVTAFASDLDHPRWLHVLPNGDVLVAEAAAPPQPELGKGIKGFFMEMAMKEAGAAVPSADRITLLRDSDGDGVADLRTAFLTGLKSPIGMALVGSDLYVANTDSIVRFPYASGATSIAEPGTRIADLPAGPYNQHWTRALVASPDGSKLYVGVGSASNIAEHGMDEEAGRAAVWEIDLGSGDSRILASGLRNPVGIAIEPHGGRLWAVVNERDELGSDVPPDYLTAVADGGFYGWPYSYWGAHVDERVEPQRRDLVGRAIVPDYGLGAHVAPLGLAFASGARLGPSFAEGAFIGLHGSWNRSPRSGYKVIFVPFVDGRPNGDPLDVLTGFLGPEGQAYGRPVGVAVGPMGGLLVADDVGNTIWLLRTAAP